MDPNSCTPIGCFLHRFLASSVATKQTKPNKINVYKVVSGTHGRHFHHSCRCYFMCLILFLKSLLESTHSFRRQGETRGKADTQSNKGKQEGTQGETRHREGGDTIQHRHTCGETMRENRRQGRQDPRKANTPSIIGTHTWGDKG